MNTYLEIASEEAPSTFYKVRVLQGTWKATLTQPMDRRRTLTGKGSKTFGKSYYVWQGVARIKFTEAANYMTMAQMSALMSSATVAGNTLRLKTFYYGDATWHNTDDRTKYYPCFFRAPFDPEFIVPYHVGVEAFYLVPFVLEQSGDPV